MESATALATYIRNNVLPSARVHPSRVTGFVAGTGNVSYSPLSVDPLQASGGFNSVVELAAVTCCQQADRAIRPGPLDKSVSAGALTTLLNNAPTGGQLSLVAPATGLLPQQNYRGFRLKLSLAGLTFADEVTAVLRFSVSLSFVYQPVLLPGVPTETVGQTWDPTSVMASAGAPEVPEIATRIENSAHTMRVAPAAGRLSDTRGNLSGVQLGSPDVPGDQDLRSIAVGSFPAELRAPLVHRDEASRCTTRVFADLRRATWTEFLPPRPAAGQPPNEILLIYDGFFSNWKSIATTLLNAPLDLPLTATLSLVGPTPGGFPVPEITDFEVRAFAVFAPPGLEPALAVAFDVMPGCHGIIEDVRHFIGPNPYGLVSDEFVVDRVFRHRWNLGGFDRRIELQLPMQVMVSRNGKQQLEDAVAFGHEDLLSLDHAAITTDSNRRADCITFGGQAQTVATSVRLSADGQTFDASQIDLGPAQPTRWGVNGIVDVNATLATDPEVQDFQLKAIRDGAQPISRPFAFATAFISPTITYARIEGIAKYVMFLGSVPAALD
jgi:hypothetical protein